MDKKLFALADVHSFYKPMEEALERAGFDIDDPSHFVILLGDMFDRGQDPDKVLRFFKSLGDRFLFVRGNHEDLLFACVQQLLSGQFPNVAHFLNGTVDTVMRFAGIDFNATSWIYEAGDERRIFRLASNVERALTPVLDFIDEKAKDYFEFGDNVFVHGYVPCKYSETAKKYSPLKNWKRGNFEAARWIDGLKAWKDGVRVGGKTVVCGHTRVDGANALYHGVESGEGLYAPFVDDGIIALDANTQCSGLCNCVVFDF